jgi:hypothetical protein
MSSTVKARPVPHITHNPELEAAAIAVANAKDGEGRAIMLCTNPLDVIKVRYSLQSASKWFDDADFYFHGQTPESETAAVENLILLATLLREHIRAGNTHDRKD